ncbi:MAG: hypothetical protein JO069_03970 [Verrucomicrobia bacterium]|nr:hypothetical protein [Verrucomicrobiota bacterium]
MAQQPISPPFGLQWGETPELVQASAQRAGSTVERRTGPAGRDRLELTGPFPGQRFCRLRFTFESERLIQVIVDYPQPEDAPEAKQLLMSVRAELEQSLGATELLETGTETNQDGYQETRHVFRWQRDGCAVWLISLEVSSGADRLRKGILSVVYSNLGLGRRLEIEAGR